MTTTRFVAPSGAPIRLRDLVRWSAAAVGRDSRLALTALMCQRFGVRHSVLTSTGRAGMTVLLRALRRLAPDNRSEVILPSYTCYSVPASIVKAGLTPRIVDLDPMTLDYDYEQLSSIDTSRALGLIATNLYGFPNDVPRLKTFSDARGIFLIDDAAQAMGATIGGRCSGTGGHAGLFSFDKGKNVCAIDGGVVVTNNDDVASALAAEALELATPRADASARQVVKALAYAAFLRPWLYGIPARIPQLGLGHTTFTLDFPLQGFDPVLAALARVMLGRLDEFTATRVANGVALEELLKGTPGIHTPRPVPGATPVYLRLPVLVSERQERSRILSQLTASGIGATSSYPSCLADVPEIRAALAEPNPSVPGGRLIAQSIVTLPTQPYVTARDRAAMARPFRRKATACAA